MKRDLSGQIYLQLIAVVLISVLVGLSILNFQIFSLGILFILLMNVAIFLSPQYFILIWLIIAGFSSIIQLPGGITSYGVMNMIFLPSLVLKIIADYQKETFQFPIIKPYCALLIIYFISIWYSPEPHLLGFRKYWSFVIPLLMGILITGAFRNSNYIEKYLKITLSFVAFMAVLSTVMFVMGKWRITGDINRAQGFFAHPNLYAMYLDFHLGVSLTLAMFLAKRKDQIFYYVISFILCFALVPTFTKGAYITCFLMFIFLSVLSIRIKKQFSQMFLGVGIILILFLFGMTFFHATLARRFSNDETLDWRINLWKGLMQQVMKSPIWGHGFGSFYHITGDVLGIKEGFSTHSQYFEILLDVGFIGLFAFLASYLGMLWYAFRVFLASSKESFIKALSLGLCVSIMATLFHCFSEGAFYIPMLNLYLWFYFAFLVALVNAEKKVVHG